MADVGVEEGTVAVFETSGAGVGTGCVVLGSIAEAGKCDAKKDDMAGGNVLDKVKAPGEVCSLLLKLAITSSSGFPGRFQVASQFQTRDPGLRLVAVSTAPNIPCEGVAASTRKSNYIPNEFDH